MRIMSCVVADCMTWSAGQDSKIHVVLVSCARRPTKFGFGIELLSNGPCNAAWLPWAHLAWHSSVVRVLNSNLAEVAGVSGNRLGPC